MATKKTGASKKRQAMTKSQNGGFLQFLPMIASAVLPGLIDKVFSGKGITKRSQKRM